MKLYAPDYYGRFLCKADKCRHSCCIGWEIDIDDERYGFYKTVGGEIGKRLANGISEDGGTAHFTLGADERCPFLNMNGLCDIISELGEDALCQICADHPRWRNFFSDRTEIGLGLCCEAAAELILTNENNVGLEIIADDSGNEIADSADEGLFELRNRLIDILQNRGEPIKARLEKMLLEFDEKLPKKSIVEWADIYLSLERLENSGTKRLEAVKRADETVLMNKCAEISETMTQQLAVYFIYRHLADAVYDGRFFERAAFSALSVYITSAVCAADSEMDFIDAARMYSAEIEYCEDNIQTLLEVLGGE